MFGGRLCGPKLQGPHGHPPGPTLYGRSGPENQATRPVDDRHQRQGPVLCLGVRFACPAETPTRFYGTLAWKVGVIDFIKSKIHIFGPLCPSDARLISNKLNWAIFYRKPNTQWLRAIVWALLAWNTNKKMKKMEKKWWWFATQKGGHGSPPGLVLGSSKWLHWIGDPCNYRFLKKRDLCKWLRSEVTSKRSHRSKHLICWNKKWARKPLLPPDPDQVSATPSRWPESWRLLV